MQGLNFWSNIYEKSVEQIRLELWCYFLEIGWHQVLDSESIYRRTVIAAVHG